MNINISISTNLTKYQTENNDVSLVGFIEEKNIINSLLGDELNNERFLELLKEEIKGFFSIVLKKDDQLFAAVDHIRSYPLFFGKDENNFYISDSAEWVRKKVKDLEMDSIAREEFQLAGYIIGNDTLYPNVKQLQAGEFLIFNNNQYEIGQYYNFDHLEPEQYNEKELKKEINEIASKTISKLINYAKGRQIVVPLSGGYDSRLIVTLLKKNKYENIVTFTYGLKGNKEANYSQIVANSLGLKWYFIEYNEKLWKEWSEHKDNFNYQFFCSNLVSIPHLQDCIAVKSLKEQGLIDENAIFVPGHSGDMIAGSHIPSFIHNDLNKIYSKNDLSEYLIEKHYNLIKTNSLDVCLYKNRVLSSVKILNRYSALDFANECERFNWRNRQSKFICNSVRLYEFYGYDWWLPLWDKDFVRFFEKLPIRLRDHKWYVSYVSEIFEQNTNIKKLNNSGDYNIILTLIKKIVNKLGFFEKIVKSFYSNFFLKDKFGWYGQFNNAKILKKHGYTYNGIVAYFFIRYLEGLDAENK